MSGGGGGESDEGVEVKRNVAIGAGEFRQRVAELPAQMFCLGKKWV